MGSFYGTQFQEYTNLFHRLFFKRKTGENNKDSKKSSGKDFIVTAEHRKDSTSFESGNYWIDLESNEAKDGVIISHMAPAEGKKTISSFEKENVGEEEILKPGESFTVSSLSFDDAGHLFSSATKTYQLQKTDVENYDDRITNLEKDMLDAQGSITDFPNTYLKQTQLDSVEKELQDQIDINKNSIEGLINEDEAIREYVRANYASLEQTGFPWQLTSASSEDDDNAYLNNDFTSFAKLIGNIEDLNATVLEQKSPMSLADGLKDFLFNFKATVNTMNIAIEGLNAKIELLESKVNELENKE